MDGLTHSKIKELRVRDYRFVLLLNVCLKKNIQTLVGSGAVWDTGNLRQSHTASSWLGCVTLFLSCNCILRSTTTLTCNILCKIKHEEFMRLCPKFPVSQIAPPPPTDTTYAQARSAQKYRYQKELEQRFNKAITHQARRPTFFLKPNWLAKY